MADRQGVPPSLSFAQLVQREGTKLRVQGPAGVMFHHFHGGRHPHAQGSMSGQDMVRLIGAIGRDRFLSAHDFVERALAGTLPEDVLCLTFDDNLMCQFEIALPVMRDMGLTGLWNINTAPLVKNVDRLELYRHYRMNAFSDVEAFYAAYFARLNEGSLGVRVRAALGGFDPDTYLAEHSVYTRNDRIFRFIRDHVLTNDEYFAVMDGMIIESVDYSVSDAVNLLWMKQEHLRVLVDEGHMIGLHTHNHPTNIAALSRAEQEREYALNASTLFEQLGVRPGAMTHPNGSYNADTLDILRGMGIRVAFRADPYLASPSLMELPRYDHAELMRCLDAPLHA